MSLTRLTMTRKGFRNNIGEVDGIVDSMLADADKSGFLPESTNIHLDLDRGQYEVEVITERRGKRGTKYNYEHLGTSENWKKSSSPNLPESNGLFQL